MCILAQNPVRVYAIRAVTPRGVQLDVEIGGAAMTNLAHAVRLCRWLADLLGRCPIATDPQCLREAWVDLVAMGTHPHQCRAVVCEQAAEASEDAPHGWREVMSLGVVRQGRIDHATR